MSASSTPRRSPPRGEAISLSGHVKITAAASLILLPLLGLKQAALFAAGSVLIDIDHYIYYVQRCGKFGLRGMFRFHDELFLNRGRIPYAGICIFHTVDFFVLTALAAAFVHGDLYFFLFGLLFHFFIDIITLSKHDYVFGRAFFVIEHLIRARRHRKRGYPYYSPCG